MAKNEFKFVISGVDLTEEQQAHVAARAAQSAVAAISEFGVRGTPLSLPASLNHWWIGIPAPEVLQEIAKLAQAGEQ